jgi:hypothetical protein
VIVVALRTLRGHLPQASVPGAMPAPMAS